MSPEEVVNQLRSGTADPNANCDRFGRLINDAAARGWFDVMVAALRLAPRPAEWCVWDVLDIENKKTRRAALASLFGLCNVVLDAKWKKEGVGVFHSAVRREDTDLITLLVAFGITDMRDTDNAEDLFKRNIKFTESKPRKLRKTEREPKSALDVATLVWRFECGGKATLKVIEETKESMRVDAVHLHEAAQEAAHEAAKAFQNPTAILSVQYVEEVVKKQVDAVRSRSASAKKLTAIKEKERDKLKIVLTLVWTQMLAEHMKRASAVVSGHLKRALLRRMVVGLRVSARIEEAFTIADEVDRAFKPQKHTFDRTVTLRPRNDDSSFEFPPGTFSNGGPFGGEFAAFTVDILATTLRSIHGLACGNSGERTALASAPARAIVAVVDAAEFLCADSVVSEASELFARLLDAPLCSVDREEALSFMAEDVAARVANVFWETE